MTRSIQQFPPAHEPVATEFEVVRREAKVLGNAVLACAGFEPYHSAQRDFGELGSGFARGSSGRAAGAKASIAKEMIDP